MSGEYRIVFIHGRAQGGRSSDEIKQEWLSALRASLGDDQTILDGVEIVAPFYGDDLDTFTEQMSAALPADLLVRGDVEDVDRDFLEFQYEIFETIRENENISTDQVAAEMEGDVTERGIQNWKWVRAILKALNRIEGLDGDLIERFTRDVWVYLTSRTVRDTINQIVKQSLETERKTLIVAHSLGTVVGYDILRDATQPETPLFMTLGSPLGIKAIRKRLVPLRHPPLAKRWFNARDTRDIVSLYPLDAQYFGIVPAITNHDQVHNHTRNAHGISGYLDDRFVVGEIRAGLAG